MFPDHDIFDAPDYTGLVFTNSKTAILYHPDFLEHLTGNHPENPRRLVVMREAILDHEVNKKLEWIEPRLCETDDISRCHTSGHIELVKKAAERAEQSDVQMIWLDPDTPVSPHSFIAACRAVGAGCEAVDMVLKKGYQSVWALVRPPGHHATPERSMGFCLFNNCACAAAYAKAVHGLNKIMIIDLDLHHGNGTQDTFYNDPTVLFTSIHQSYAYPGTGHIDEIGVGDGRGYTINFPILAKSGDGEFSLYMREVVGPVADQFRPQLLLVSMGFDAHVNDPLGYLAVSSGEFGKMVTMIRAIAADLGIGIVYTLEGGYSLESQAESIVECMISSTSGKFDPGNLPMPYRPSQGAIAALDHLRAAHKGIWNF